MSAAVSSHGGTGPLSLMSCVRESSPPQDLAPEYETEKNVSSKKRFWNPRKWFKRKNNKVADELTTTNDIVENKETLRSRSTSELSEPEEIPRRRSGAPMHPGLSVSHDSVFHSPHSGSEIELEGAQSSSSLSIHNNLPSDRLQSELTEKLRLRRGRGDTSEDDEGLPRSPCNSPTATEKTAIKDHPTKSHSTCSEGSLNSMGSSEIEEDLSANQSLGSSIEAVSELETVQNSSYPLNHSAAHHRVSVRPNRRHGAPRRNRNQQLAGTALPTTPEVNEESSVRSVTPDISTTTRDAVTELYSGKTASAKQTRTFTENQLKCSSLPPGLAPPGSEMGKLNRSRSNAGTKSQDEIGTLGEEDEGQGKKTDSFLGKLFIRRSGKKKKPKDDKTKDEKTKEEKTKEEKTREEKTSPQEDVTDSNATKIMVTHTDRKSELPPKPLPRSGAASRQRVIPNDIPASPELSLRTEELIQPKSSPEKTNLPSPLHLELENRLQQRFQLSSSPTKSPPISPKTTKTITSPITSPPRSPILSKSPPNIYVKHKVVETREDKKEDRTHQEKTETTMSKIETTKSKIETTKSKVIITGLSPFQKKAMTLNEDEGFKSLTDLEAKPTKPVAKSHSFKSTKTDSIINHQTVDKSELLVKANSLDSVKNLETSTMDSTVQETETKEQKLVESSTVKVVSTVSETEFSESSGITISGPSHTHKAVVSIGTAEAMNTVVEKAMNEVVKKEEISIKEQQISVTKIQLKSTTQVITKPVVPEFMNVQLHKVEKPTNNVILTTSISKEEDKPKIKEETERPEPQIVEATRKFSKDEIEIIEKDAVFEEIEEKDEKKHVATAMVTITSMTPPKASKKPDNLPIRKSFAPGNDTPKEKPTLKVKSCSLDMVESIKPETIAEKSTKTEEIKTRTHSVNDISDVEIPVVLRRKSLAKQKNDDEPELMKVFARRSLKLKDNESETISQQVIASLSQEEQLELSKSRDSDKENQQDSPVEERKRSKETTKEPPKVKEPLIETKIDDSVTFRKPAVNNKISSYQRTVSLSNPKTDGGEKIQKQFSLTERPKTELIKNQVDEIISIKEKQFLQEEIIAKPNIFNQRKAEWEKRAQESQRKTTP